MPTNYISTTCSMKCGCRIRSTARLSLPVPWRQCPSGSHWYTTRGGKRCDCRSRATHLGTHARRTAHYGGRYEEVDRDVVFKRDRWTCQLCGKPINRRAKWPDPSAVSLDHVVPLSRGGDHTYANTQCAHLGCNWSKNARCPQPEQLRLVG